MSLHLIQLQKEKINVFDLNSNLLYERDKPVNAKYITGFSPFGKWGWGKSLDDKVFVYNYITDEMIYIPVPEEDQLKPLDASFCPNYLRLSYSVGIRDDITYIFNLDTFELDKLLINIGPDKCPYYYEPETAIMHLGNEWGFRLSLRVYMHQLKIESIIDVCENYILCYNPRRTDSMLYDIKTMGILLRSINSHYVRFMYVDSELKIFVADPSPKLLNLDGSLLKFYDPNLKVHYIPRLNAFNRHKVVAINNYITNDMLLFDSETVTGLSIPNIQYIVDADDSRRRIKSARVKENVTST